MSEAHGDVARPGNLLAIVQAVGLVVVAVIPAFLTGTLAVGIRAELGFGPAALGFAVAWFFVATSVCSALLGQVVERLGVRRSSMLGATMSCVALIGLGTAPSYPWLVVAMTLGGAANATTQPAVNASLSRRISATRLGLAFGVKQAAIPTATLLGGLAVPTLAVLLGWRGTFLTVAGIAALGVLMAARGADPAVAVRRPRRRLRDMPEVGSLAILSLGGLLGAAAATSLGVFLVDAGVAGGIEEGRAGLMVAAVSACGLLARIALGWLADARPARSRYGTIAVLLLTGAPGYVILGAGPSTTYVLGAFLAYAAGWAWPGLFHYAVVSQNPASPAAATGVIQTGLSMGAGLGPLVFGTVAETAGYAAAWFVAAGLSAGAAGVLLLGRAHLRRRRRDASVAHLHEVTALSWEEAPSDEVTTGVQVQRRATDNLEVVLYRAAPGVTFDAEPAPRTGLVVVLDGHEVHLCVAGAARSAGRGVHVPLPANRPWQLHNRGQVPSTLARIQHRGNGEREAVGG